ncbi:MAG: trypsin-like peptidase domain-containing protein [Eubacteriales bacterium]|nr:trypsin-like peptidase domain-containing protein [Eubacteriales bacterium]
MDTFEQNEQFNQTNQDQQPQPETGVYHAAGAGRRESPYANSPYAAQTPPEEGYRYEPQSQPPRKAPREHSGAGRKVLAAVLALVILAGSCLATGLAVSAHISDENESMTAELNQRIDQLQKQLDSKSATGSTVFQSPVSDGTLLTPDQLYAQCVPSVVAVSSTVTQMTPYGSSEGSSSGSGFILTADGYIVTNHHVVEGASSVSITTYDGTKYPAEVVGSNQDNDIAVLKVEAENLPAATVGSSDALNTGDMVAAIGNPLGTLASTQTVGYVSGINREVTTSNTIINMIQTDAAINPGNSGGPLFNMKGEVVGITTAKYSGTTGSGASIEGIGFAIPIDDVTGIISDLMEYGYVTGAYLGVTVQNTDAESASMFGLPTGAYVVSVTDGGSADRAGVQPKDIIVALGDRQIGSVTELTRALRDYKGGDVTTITVIRSGGEKVLDITLDEKPQQTDTQTTPQEELPMPSDGDYDEWYDYFRRYFGN